MSRATRSVRIPLALLVALFPLSVAGVDFTLGESNDILGKWDTTVSIAAGWRVQDRNPALYSPANGNLQGLPTGTGGNADDGNLNYGKGDNFLTVAAVFSTLELSKGGYGGLVKFVAWYDYTLSQRGVPHGNEANNYVAGKPLGDQGFPTLAKFDGITALDLYAYGSWDLGEDKLSVRLGRQVVNWGKSLVLQGVDQINPIEINTLRRPGTRLEEALIPVGLLYGDLQLASGTRVEAFYQFEWQATVLEPCGTYFSSIDALVSPKTPGSGCPAAVVNAPDPVGYPSQQFVPLAPTTQPKDGGQFGVAVRQKIESLDTEFALYAMNIHSRVPVLNGIRGVVTFQAQADATGQINPKGVWAYPDNIRIYGVSASSRMAGWALGAELSYTANLPVQISVGDAIAGLLYPTLGVPTANWGPLGPRVLATPVGAEFLTYDRASKTMLILNAVKAFPDVLGARNAVLAVEVGLSWAAGLDENMRYGRGYVFGIARSPTYGPFNEVVAGGCPLLNTPDQPGCAPDGFFSRFAWGYRLRAQLNYANVAGSGVTISPHIFWLQDVRGYSVDNQMIQDRKTLALGVNFAFPKNFNLGLLYTWYADDAPWNPTRDRDFIGGKLSYSF
jgi:hypothetical protein